MKASKTITLFACIALACIAVQKVTSKPDSAQAAKITDFGFGLKMAGSWYGSFQAVIPDAPPPLLAVYTVTADGGGVVASPEMHGAGFPALLGLRTTFHLTWTRTGIRETTWTGLDFALDEDGNLGVPAYGGAGIVRISGVGQFDKDFQTYSGTGMIDAFMADQDPLDANEEPVVSIPIVYEYRRINAM